MTANVRSLNRALGGILGLVPAFAVGAPKWIKVLAGPVMVSITAKRFCPFNRIIGIRTSAL